MIQHFPKKDRYTLGQKSEQLALHILELLFVANSVQTAERLNTQKEIDLKLKILKTIIRASYDVHAIDQKRYLQLEVALYEIGRMLGGWIKTTKETNIYHQKNHFQIII